MESSCPACLDPVPAAAAECPHCGLTFGSEPDGVWRAAPAAEFAEFLVSPALDPVAAPARSAEPITSPLPVLPDATKTGLHTLIDEVIAQMTAIWPALALDWGLHPHPREFAPPGDDATDRTRALAKAALDRVDEWERAGSGTAHDRLDATALRTWLQPYVLDCGESDEATLAGMRQLGGDLLQLSDVACCDAADRADSALARLGALAVECRDAVESLVAPNRSSLLVVMRVWEWVAHELPTYADRWRELDRRRIAALHAASNAAAAEIARLMERLRTEVLPRARDGACLGAAELESRLRRWHGLPRSVREIYCDAVEEYAAVSAELESTDAGQDPLPWVSAEAPLDVAKRLAARSGEWVTRPPIEPGLRTSPALRSQIASGAAAIFRHAGIISPSTAAVVWITPDEVVSERTGEVDPFRCAWRDHTIAHETFPGHRLAHLVGQTACPMRRVTDDRFTIEGWAVYAEDLLHDVGACIGGPADRVVRAETRRHRAVSAMIAILRACGAASDDRLLELLGAPAGAESSHGAGSDADPNAPPSSQRDEALLSLDTEPLSALHYFVGPREIRRLRALVERAEGASFDARQFHRRLLEEGPVSARWIAAAWGLTED